MTSFILLALLLTCVCGWLFAKRREPTVVHELWTASDTMGPMAQMEVSVHPDSYSGAEVLAYLVAKYGLPEEHRMVQAKFVDWMCHLVWAGTVENSQNEQGCVDEAGTTNREIYKNFAKSTTRLNPYVRPNMHCFQRTISEYFAIWEAGENAFCASTTQEKKHHILHAYTGNKPTCACQKGFCTLCEYSDRRVEFWDQARDTMHWFVNQQFVEQLIIVVSPSHAFDRAYGLWKMFAVQKKASKEHCSGLFDFCRNINDDAHAVENTGQDRESYIAFCKSAEAYKGVCRLSACEDNSAYKKMVHTVRDEHLRRRLRGWYVQLMFYRNFGEEELNRANAQDSQLQTPDQLPLGVWCHHDKAKFEWDNGPQELDAYIELVDFGDTTFFRYVEWIFAAALIMLAVMRWKRHYLYNHYLYKKWEAISARSTKKVTALKENAENKITMVSANKRGRSPGRPCTH